MTDTLIEDANTNGTLDTETDTPVAEYRYDGLGRRTVKLLPNGENWNCTDYYQNESRQVLEGRYGANQAKETVPTAARCQYVWDGRYVHSPACRFRDTDSNGTLDETLYYCNDANFNVTALVDTGGSVVERYWYEPYGQVHVCAADWTPRENNTSAYANGILFTGHRLDPETGLYHGGARYYHPTLGRWLGRDAGYWDGVGLYAYVRGRPCTLLDPLGLEGRMPDLRVEATLDMDLAGWVARSDIRSGVDAQRMADVSGYEEKFLSDEQLLRDIAGEETRPEFRLFKNAPPAGSAVYAMGWTIKATPVCIPVSNGIGKWVCDASGTKFKFRAYAVTLDAELEDNTITLGAGSNAMAVPDWPQTVPGHEQGHTDGVPQSVADFANAALRQAGKKGVYQRNRGYAGGARAAIAAARKRFEDLTNGTGEYANISAITVQQPGWCAGQAREILSHFLIGESARNAISAEGVFHGNDFTDSNRTLVMPVGGYPVDQIEASWNRG